MIQCLEFQKAVEINNKPNWDLDILGSDCLALCPMRSLLATLAVIVSVPWRVVASITESTQV